MSRLFSRLVPKTIASVSITLLVVAIAVVIVVMSNKGTETKEWSDDLTHTIMRGDLTVSVTEQGRLESSNNDEIRNRVRGFSVVTEVVEVGKIVKKGDVLVRLDTKAIEDQLSTAKTNVNTAKANLARSAANEKTSLIARNAYLEGRYVSQMNGLKRQLMIAEKRLEIAKIKLEGDVKKNGNKTKRRPGTRQLYAKSFVNREELDADEFAVTQYRLEKVGIENSIVVLENYTKPKELATLNGNIRANKIKRQSDEAALKEEEKRMERIQRELKDCVLTAPRDGLVIYPSAAAWKQSPDIDEGASVRMDQTLLLMPDLDKMQVMVGIHESIVDQLEIGMKAIIKLSDQEESFTAEVSKIASVTKPAGWWTGNVVKYDTIIKLPSRPELKPGMTAEVEIVLATHQNVIKIPVAAVVELDEGSFCWVEKNGKLEKRKIELGDSNDIFIVVESGVDEGEKVILNPLAQVEEAQTEAQKLINQSKSFKE